MTRRIATRLFSYMKHYRLELTGAILSAILSVLATLIGPMLIGKAIDLMVKAGQVNFAAILKLLLILSINYVLVSLFSWLLTYLTNLIAYQTVNDLRHQLFEKLNHLPLSFFDSTPYGDTISRFVNDVDTISDGMLQGIATFLTSVFMILGTIAFMLYLNPLMAVVVMFSAPASFFIANKITRKTQTLFKQQAKSLGNLNSYAEEIIEGQEIVKAFSFEKATYEKFADLNNTLNVVGLKAQFFSSLTNPSARLLNNLTYSIVGIVGGISAILGRISIGGISSFLIYSNLFGRPFNDITSVLTQIQASFASAQRVFEVLDLPAEPPDPARTLTVRAGEEKIQFDHVDFSYNSRHPLIHNFNLEIKPGHKVAIVGHTGAGKTTLVNLLMRYYDINSGIISINGVNIHDVSRDSLRRNFGMVPQDTWLFSGSIRDNIAYGRPDATDAEIIEAAKAVHAHGFIMQLSRGYDTLLTDAGDNLSQGQKQLLTIARVMLVNPPILILDEATSSIDTRTELYIQKAFLQLSAGKTSFIIAHRLSTVREADIILVLDQGNIVESGTHEELLKKGGFYATLYYSQFAPSK